MADNHGQTSNVTDYDRSKGGQSAQAQGGGDTSTDSGGSSTKQGDSGSAEGATRATPQVSNK